MKRLHPCSQCLRHVRTDETECPFCAAPVMASAPQSTERAVAKITRAALFAGAAFLLPACGGPQAKTVDQNRNTDQIAIPIDGGVPARTVETGQSDAVEETLEEREEREKREQAEQQAKQEEHQRQLQRLQEEQGPHRGKRPPCIKNKKGQMICPPYGAPSSIDDLVV